MLEVKMGQKLEITREEVRLLAELTHNMASLVRHQRPGWFVPYFMAHREIHKLFKTLVDRAQAGD